MRKDPLFRLTGAQLRAARGLLDLTAEALAAESRVSLRTIRRAEKMSGPVQITAANAHAIASVLETLGVQFISANGGGPGVRLKGDASPKAERAKTTRRSKGRLSNR